jgi:hypothetical protein
MKRKKAKKKITTEKYQSYPRGAGKRRTRDDKVSISKLAKDAK